MTQMRSNVLDEIRVGAPFPLVTTKDNRLGKLKGRQQIARLEMRCVKASCTFCVRWMGGLIVNGFILTVLLLPQHTIQNGNSGACDEII